MTEVRAGVLATALGTLLLAWLFVVAMGLSGQTAVAPVAEAAPNSNLVVRLAWGVEHPPRPPDGPPVMAYRAQVPSHLFRNEQPEPPAIVVAAAVPSPGRVARFDALPFPVDGFYQQPYVLPEETLLLLVSAYDWPIDGALATLRCESGGDAHAISVAGALGLFQLHPPRPEYLDPATNVANAYSKWLAGGRSFFAHWTKWGGCGAGW